MDMQAFVRTVAEEVLRRLREESGLCVLVLAHRSAALEEKVRQTVGRDAYIVFQGEDLGHRKPERHILPHLSCNDMADLAAGRAEGLLQRELLQLLLTGMSVEVLEFAYTAFRHTAPAPLYALYAEYEKKLASFGLIAVRPTLPATAIATAGTEGRAQRALVTEKTVLEAQAQGLSAIAAAPGALVTPLAAETARNAGITILEEDLHS